jgi:hypothetical protein
MNPRRLVIAYTIPVTFEIPESFPLAASEIESIVKWKVVDSADGRYPFSTELMADGATRAAQGHVEDAIFHHYCRRVEAAFGHGGWEHIEARNKLIERCANGVKIYGRAEHGVTAEVRVYGRTVLCPGCGFETLVEQNGRRYKTCVCGGSLVETEPAEASAPAPRAPDGHDPHVVLARRDRDHEDAPPGAYEVATRTVFESRAAAEAYAATCSTAREPLVVAMPVSGLRVGEDRGRLGYWKTGT